jgi:hypothetical protein
VIGGENSSVDVRSSVIGLRCLHREGEHEGASRRESREGKTEDKEGSKARPTIMNELMMEIVFTRHLFPPISPNNEANSSLSGIKRHKLALNYDCCSSNPRVFMRRSKMALV